MNRFFKCALFAVGFSYSSQTLASDVLSQLSAQVALVSNSCDYYSSMNASIRVSLEAQDVPSDATVVVHHGFEGQGFAAPASAYLDWQSMGEAQMARGADGRWNVEWTSQIHSRTSSRAPYQGLNFVIRIEESNGSVRYLKNNSAEGFYRGVWSLSGVPCANPAAPKPTPWKTLSLESVARGGQ